MKYNIEICETSCLVKTVEADSECDALRLVRNSYMKEEIVLSADNSFVDVDFRAL